MFHNRADLESNYLRFIERANEKDTVFYLSSEQEGTIMIGSHSDDFAHGTPIVTVWSDKPYAKRAMMKLTEAGRPCEIMEVTVGEFIDMLFYIQEHGFLVGPNWNADFAGLELIPKHVCLDLFAEVGETDVELDWPDHENYRQQPDDYASNDEYYNAQQEQYAQQLRDAIYNEDEQAVAEILATIGEGVHYVDDDHICPLQSAIRLELNTIAEMIIRHKDAQVGSCRDSEGRTVLLDAVSYAPTLIKMILECPGVDQNTADDYLITPLHMAVILNVQDAVNTLLQTEGVDVNARDNEGCTPLHYAIIEDIPIYIFNRLMKVENIDVNAQTNIGNTPLHCAADFGKKEIMNVLLDHEAVDLYIKNQNGLTAIDATKDN